MPEVVDVTGCGVVTDAGPSLASSHQLLVVAKGAACPSWCRVQCERIGKTQANSKVDHVLPSGWVVARVPVILGIVPTLVGHERLQVIVDAGT